MYLNALFITSKFDKNKVQFPIRLKTKNGKILATHQFTALFRKTDLSKRHLEEKKPLTVKVFDYTSKEDLDNFLTKFPNSDFAPALFRLRLEYCRKLRDKVLKENNSLSAKTDRDKNLLKAINAYNEFIAKYPKRLLTKVAVHECFQLYTLVNRITFYTNFIQRYPDTNHSLVAKEYIKCLIFNVVCVQNTVKAYDKFLVYFPENSFYTKKCIELAKKKAIEEEKGALAENPAAAETRIDLLFASLFRLKRQYNNSKNKLLIARQISRKRAVIESIYATKASRTLILIELIYEVLKLQKQIKSLMIQQHQQTMNSMDNHFSELRKHLDENFKKINVNIGEVKSKVEQLHKDLKLMHTDMHKRLDKVDNKLNNIETQIRKGFSKVNKKLDVGFAKIDNHFKILHKDLNEINTSIIKISDGVGQLKEHNKKFLYSQTSMLANLEDNGKLYTGYQETRSEIMGKDIASSYASAAIGVGITVAATASLPVAAGAAIVTFAVAPVIDWLGSAAVDGAISLWKSIW